MPRIAPKEKKGGLVGSRFSYWQCPECQHTNKPTAIKCVKCSLSYLEMLIIRAAQKKQSEEKNEPN